MKSLLSAMSLMVFAIAVSNAQSLGLPTSISSNSGSTSGQPDSWGRPSPDSRAWTDPALNHNNLLIGEGKYQLVGPYKVKGSSYLLGQKHRANLFSATEKAWNIFISYNTYNQEVEFYSTSNPNVPLVKEPGTLDSFVVLENASAGIVSSMKFIYGPGLNIKDKSYYQQLYSGPQYSLYKRYKAELDFDGTNYGQSELRIFTLKYEYYYSNPGSKGLKKLKPGISNLISEFKEVKDLSAVVNNEAFTTNPEGEMQKAFDVLNK